VGVKAVSIIAGQMAPLPRANVDTDQIIPKQFLKRVERHGYGPFLFYDWRFDHEGEVVDEFVLNQPEYGDAKVLVAGPSFGIGSSREHAAWSIDDWGFEAVVAPSFGDIFYNNSINIGLLPVVLTIDEVMELVELAHVPDNQVRIDLDKQTVSSGSFRSRFDIDPHVKHRLLAGLDNVGETLLHGEAIGSFEAVRPGYKPVVSNFQ
jgi:3-isopropylmalate/(R)-2-methylmalate dehydratase small subunit